MRMDDKRVFFDRLAESWDHSVERDQLRKKLSAGLSEFCIEPAEVIIDLGCGTGNLTEALLGFLSGEGRVVAVDFSEEMLRYARAKINDDRVEWVHADALSIPVSDASVDRVICYCTWPHFSFPNLVIREIGRVLKPAGWLHIWHSDSREKINYIHKLAGGVIACDLMIPATDLAELLCVHGFSIGTIIDDSERYLITAQNIDNRG